MLALQSLIPPPYSPQASQRLQSFQVRCLETMRELVHVQGEKIPTAKEFGKSMASDQRNDPDVWCFAVVGGTNFVKYDILYGMYGFCRLKLCLFTIVTILATSFPRIHSFEKDKTVGMSEFPNLQGNIS